MFRYLEIFVKSVHMLGTNTLSFIRRAHGLSVVTKSVCASGNYITVYGVCITFEVNHQMPHYHSTKPCEAQPSIPRHKITREGCRMCKSAWIQSNYHISKNELEVSHLCWGGTALTKGMSVCRSSRRRNWWSRASSCPTNAATKGATACCCSQSAGT